MDSPRKFPAVLFCDAGVLYRNDDADAAVLVDAVAAASSGGDDVDFERVVGHRGGQPRPGSDGQKGCC